MYFDSLIVLPQTPLLSRGARLNLNLFLNRLEEEPGELVRRLVRVDRPPLPLAFVKHLLEILPEAQEVSATHLLNLQYSLLQSYPDYVV